MNSYHLDHLQYLETEAIHVMREVAAEFERPALLFSGGKDSICLLRLAEKAFRPSDLPTPLFGGTLTVEKLRAVDAFGRVLDLPAIFGADHRQLSFFTQ